MAIYLSTQKSRPDDDEPASRPQCTRFGHCNRLEDRDCDSLRAIICPSQRKICPSSFAIFTHTLMHAPWAWPPAWARRRPAWTASGARAPSNTVSAAAHRPPPLRCGQRSCHPRSPESWAPAWAPAWASSLPWASLPPLRAFVRLPWAAWRPWASGPPPLPAAS